MLKKLYIFYSIFLSIHSFAQDSTRTHDLNEVVISANIMGSELRSTARNISVITQKTIENAPVKTLDGILQYAQNVDVRSRSSVGVQADISIRGGHYDQTLILVDGVKVNDPQTGHHSLNIPVPFHLIEKIEIMQGGASRVYGPNAFSGVINIISKKVDKDALSLSSAMGQFGLWQGVLSVQKQLSNNNAIRLTWENGKSNGFTDYTGYKKNTGNAQFFQNLKNGDLNFNLGYMSNDFGASNFYHPKFNRQYEEVSAWLASGQWNQNFGNSLTGTALLSYRRHHDFFDFNEYRLKNQGHLINFHRSDVWEADYKLRKNHTNSKGAIGFNFRSENIISNRLGTPMQEEIITPYADTLFFNKNALRNNASLFLEHQRSIHKFKISTGFLVNYNSDFGAAWYPGIDVSYPVGRYHNLYFSSNRSLRYPTFTELFLTGPTVISDPNLRPEKAWTQELGVKWNQKFHSSTFAIFYRSTQDAIDKISIPTSNVPLMKNIDHVNMTGVEVSQTIYISEMLRCSLPFKLIWNYAYLMADRKETGFQSFYTLNYLRHKFTSGIELAPFKNFNLSSYYTFKYREGEYQLDVGSPLIAYKPIHLVDIRSSYAIKNHRAFLDINNLLNYEYFEFGFVKQPGRWISGGIILNF